MLQFLIHLVRPADVVLAIRHSNWQLPVLCILHRLFQHCMHDADDVPCQV